MSAIRLLVVLVAATLAVAAAAFARSFPEVIPLPTGFMDPRRGRRSVRGRRGSC